MASLLLLTVTVRAEDYTERMRKPFPIPDHYQLVNDYEEVLLISHRVVLEKRLRALERHNGTQIVFLSIPNAGPGGAERDAAAVFKKWNIGNDHQHNGILLLIAQNEARIVTDAGIAGAVPDVMATRLLRDVLVPAAERNDMSTGVEQALEAMIEASYGEVTHMAASPAPKELIPDTLSATERRWVILLCALSAAYAGWLLWQRFTCKRRA